MVLVDVTSRCLGPRHLLAGFKEILLRHPSETPRWDHLDRGSASCKVWRLGLGQVCAGNAETDHKRVG